MQQMCVEVILKSHRVSHARVLGIIFLIELATGFRQTHFGFSQNIKTSTFLNVLNLHFLDAVRETWDFPGLQPRALFKYWNPYDVI